MMTSNNPSSLKYINTSNKKAPSGAYLYENHLITDS